MAKVNEVEVKVDQDYIYLYCDDCVTRIPEFIKDTERKVDTGDATSINCDGCGKEMVDNAET